MDRCSSRFPTARARSRSAGKGTPTAGGRGLATDAAGALLARAR
ncbi:MAG: hypothetical protein ACR2M0_16385 [Chloroflexia bacterium]